MRHEIVAIGRCGYSLLHTEGADFAAKITYLQYIPGEVYDPRVGVLQERLIPIPGRWE